MLLQASRSHWRQRTAGWTTWQKTAKRNIYRFPMPTDLRKTGLNGEQLDLESAPKLELSWRRVTMLEWLTWTLRSRLEWQLSKIFYVCCRCLCLVRHFPVLHLQSPQLIRQCCHGIVKLGGGKTRNCVEWGNEERREKGRDKRISPL